MSIAKPRAFWPQSTVGGTALDWYNGTTNRSTFLGSGTYYDPETLLAAVVAAMNALDGAVHTGTLLSDGRTQFTGPSGWFFRFGSVTDPVAAVLGFPNTNTSAGVTQTSPSPMQNLWVSPVAVVSDSGDLYEFPGDVQTMALSGANKLITEGSGVTVRQLDFDFMPPESTLIRREVTTANLNKAVERLVRNGAARFRYWGDVAALSSYGDYYLGQDSIEGFKPTRLQTKEIYAFSLALRGYVE